MNNQEAFDTMVKHLAKQKEKAIDPNDLDSCLYRSPTGLKCAVGALIPDELYSSEFEGNSIIGVLDSDIELSQVFKEVDNGLLDGAQDIHDRTPIMEWKHHFKNLGSKFNLSTLVVDTYMSGKWYERK